MQIHVHRSQGLDIVKVSILLKLTYEVNPVSIKILIGFFRNKQADSKICMETKDLE